MDGKHRLARVADAVTDAVLTGHVGSDCVEALAFLRSVCVRVSVRAGPSLITTSNLQQQGYIQLSLLSTSDSAAGLALRKGCIDVPVKPSIRRVIHDVNHTSSQHPCAVISCVPILAPEYVETPHQDTECVPSPHSSGAATPLGVITAAFAFEHELDDRVRVALRALARKLSPRLARGVPRLLDELRLFGVIPPNAAASGAPLPPQKGWPPSPQGWSPDCDDQWNSDSDADQDASGAGSLLTTTAADDTMSRASLDAACRRCSVAAAADCEGSAEQEHTDKLRNSVDGCSVHPPTPLATLATGGPTNVYHAPGDVSNCKASNMFSNQLRDTPHAAAMAVPGSAGAASSRSLPLSEAKRKAEVVAAAGPFADGICPAFASPQLERAFVRWQACGQLRVDMLAICVYTSMLIAGDLTAPLSLLQLPSHEWWFGKLTLLFPVLAAYCCRKSYLRWREVIMISVWYGMYIYAVGFALPKAIPRMSLARLQRPFWMMLSNGTFTAMTLPLGNLVRFKIFLPAQLMACLHMLLRIPANCAYAYAQSSVGACWCTLGYSLVHLLLTLVLPAILVRKIEVQSRRIFLQNWAVLEAQ